MEGEFEHLESSFFSKSLHITAPSTKSQVYKQALFINHLLHIEISIRTRKKQLLTNRLPSPILYRKSPTSSSSPSTPQCQPSTPRASSPPTKTSPSNSESQSLRPPTSHPSKSQSSAAPRSSGDRYPRAGVVALYGCCRRHALACVILDVR